MQGLQAGWWLVEITAQAWWKSCGKFFFQLQCSKKCEKGDNGSTEPY
jgi:hypothetical protein